jgi:DNA-binding winged helix-turn-helix (wHTH) protein
MSAAPPVATYRFAGFVLDIQRGSLLTAAGEVLSLRRQSFELLRLLVENAGLLLDRDTINRAIWADVAVTDDSITQCVRDIRRVIGDNAQGILKTVPRRGYVLAVDVVIARDPLTWLWAMWTGTIQFFSRNSAASLETFNELVRLRPEWTTARELIAGSLVFLGRRNEARAALQRAGSPIRDPRYQQRPPWLRPEDYALRSEGLRRASEVAIGGLQ